MKQGIPRKDFLKGAAALAAVGIVAGAGMPASAATVAAPAAGAKKDGDRIDAKLSVDILIVGGGMAGLCAGIRALEAGFKNIVVIDKATGKGFNWGGSSMVCGGSLLIPRSGSKEDAQAYAKAVFKKGLETGDMALINALADGAWDGYQWLLQHGVSYKAPVSVFPANPEVLTAVSDMMATMPALRDAYTKAGGKIVYNTRAVKLNYDSTGIGGVLVQGPDGFYSIAAKRTLLCTGGYTANKQFLEDHVGDMGAKIMCRSRESATGDGIYMAQAVGGYTVNSRGLKSVHLSAVDPIRKERGQPGNEIPYMIAINSEGKRFMDEALGSVRHGQAVFAQSVPRDGLLFDSKVWDKVSGTMDKLHKEGVTTWKADTIEEMAKFLNVDPAALAETVKEFNARVDAKKGTTSGLAVNKSAKALPIDTPPYYGIYPLVPGTSISFGGIATSVKAEVLQADGTPVANLYACGEGTGGFFYDDYFGGACLTRNVVFGRIAMDSAIASLKA